MSKIGPYEIVLSSMLKDESGQDLIEYFLVAAIIAFGAVAAIKTLATIISGSFTNIDSRLSSNT